MSSSKNQEFEKTSFLSKSNNSFIEQMYLKFINKDTDLPESWQNYFEGMGDELNIIIKEIRNIRFVIFILFNPDVQSTISSLSFSNFKIVSTVDIRKQKGINFVKTLDIVKKE